MRTDLICATFAVAGMALVGCSPAQDLPLDPPESTRASGATPSSSGTVGPLPTRYDDGVHASDDELVKVVSGRSQGKMEYSEEGVDPGPRYDVELDLKADENGLVRGTLRSIDPATKQQCDFTLHEGGLGTMQDGRLPDEPRKDRGGGNVNLVARRAPGAAVACSVTSLLHVHVQKDRSTLWVTSGTGAGGDVLRVRKIGDDVPRLSGNPGPLAIADDSTLTDHLVSRRSGTLTASGRPKLTVDIDLSAKSDALTGTMTRENSETQEKCYLLMQETGRDRTQGRVDFSLTPDPQKPGSCARGYNRASLHADGPQGDQYLTVGGEGLPEYEGRVRPQTS